MLLRQKSHTCGSSVMRATVTRTLHACELYKLQIDEKEASSRLTSEHPRVQALRRQVAETEAILNKQDARRSQTTRKLNPVYQETQRDLLVAEALQAAEAAEAKSLDHADNARVNTSR